MRNTSSFCFHVGHPSSKYRGIFMPRKDLGLTIILPILTLVWLLFIYNWASYSANHVLLLSFFYLNIAFIHVTCLFLPQSHCNLLENDTESVPCTWCVSILPPSVNFAKLSRGFWTLRPSLNLCKFLNVSETFSSLGHHHVYVPSISI